jgi:hypothetical protein
MSKKNYFPSSIENDNFFGKRFPINSENSKFSFNSNQEVNDLTISFTLQSISLLNNQFSATYSVKVSNKGQKTATNIKIKDEVTFTTGPVTALSGTVSYTSDPVIVKNLKKLIFPTIPSIFACDNFTFTFTLNATVNAAATVSVNQCIKVIYYVSHCKHSVCFNVKNSTAALDCPITFLQLDAQVTTIIPAPGHYKVINSPTRTITGVTGTTPANPFIQIAIRSGDVFLDICENDLTGSGNQTQPFSALTGPSVPAGVSNDTRVDSAIGISIQGTEDNILDNITITNGKLQWWSLGAIRGAFATNVNVNQLLVEMSGTVTIGAGSAVFFNDCSQLNINEVRFFNNRFSDLRIICAVASQFNLTLTNCQSTGLRGGAIAGFFNSAWLAVQEYIDIGIAAEAIDIRNSTEDSLMGNILIEKWQLSNIKAAAVVFGIFIQSQCDGTVVRENIVVDLEQPLADLTIFATTPSNLTPNYEIRGIAVETGSRSTLVEDNLVSNLRSSIKLTPQPGNGSGGFGTGNGVTGYNCERVVGKVIRNNVASLISSSGKITSLVPDSLGQLVTDMFAIGFSSEIEHDDPISQNYQFIGCQANTISGGTDTDASPGVGFLVYNTKNGTTDADYSQSFSGTFTQCLAQDTYGNNKSAGFAVTHRLPDPDNVDPFSPVIFTQCKALNDRIRAPAGAVSHGFFTDVRGNNIVFQDCIALGHRLNGFDLAGWFQDTPPGLGNGKMLLQNCISNGNSGYGMRLDATINQVDLVGCNTDNNGIDGLKVDGRNITIRKQQSDTNTGQGVIISPFFPFTVKVATDSSNVGMLNLGVYAGAYTVTYVPATIAAPNYFQYFNIIPNNSAAPLPASLTINGITVNNGDQVLIKDLTGADPNTGGALNGVYVASNQGGVVVGGITIPVWQLIRVQSWRAPNIVPSGTKVLTLQSNAPNLTPAPVQYTLTNATTVDLTTPIFSATINLVPLTPSRILLEDSNMGLNGSNGVHNQAADVTVRKTKCDRNSGTAFLDDSAGGAQANLNLYARNRAWNNGAGALIDNFNVDYITIANTTVLQTGVFPLFPANNPPEANLSITIV